MAQKGFHALGREAGGESHRVLLGDADVEHALRKALAKMSRPVPLGMAAVTATTRESLAPP